MYLVSQIAVSLAMMVSVAMVEMSATDSFVMTKAALLGVGIGLVVTQPVFAAIYNRRYYADLLNDGFEEWSS